jgi:hypothetical protein
LDFAPPDPRRKSSAPAARNREAILGVLERVFPAHGSVIEIASGTGEHAVFFGASLPNLAWQPSDVDPSNLASIDAWVEFADLPNVSRPLTVELGADAHFEPRTSYDAGFCANLIHIAPWQVCAHLMAFMSARLTLGAPLVTYGPYKVDGAHTSESNARFEEWLLAQNPAYGVRDMAAVIAEAARFGLRHEETIAMPANNFCLTFRNGS